MVDAIKDSVATASEVAAVATAADVKTVQVTSVSRNQLSTVEGGACQEEEGVDAVVGGPSAGSQRHAAVTATVEVAASDQVGCNVTAKFEKMMKKLQTEKVALHVELVARRAAPI